MKVNEVLEKIYINVIPSTSGGYVYTTVNKDFPNAVEYIPINTFIKKARKWFEREYEWYDKLGVRHCDMKEFYDFINYIKGE